MMGGKINFFGGNEACAPCCGAILPIGGVVLELLPELWRFSVLSGRWHAVGIGNQF